MTTFFEKNYDVNCTLDTPVDFEACAATVQNVVVCGDCKLRIDLDTWTTTARSVPGLTVACEPQKLRGVVIRRDKHAIVVFPSGKYILSGFTQDSEGAEFLLDVFRRCGFPTGPATLADAKIVNMVVTMRLPFKVNLDTLRCADPHDERTKESSKRWQARAKCHKIFVQVGTQLKRRGNRQIEKPRMLHAVIFESGSCILVGMSSQSERERFQRRVYNYLDVFSTGEESTLDVDDLTMQLEQITLAKSDDEHSDADAEESDEDEQDSQQEDDISDDRADHW